MRAHARLNDELRDQATAYVAGVLPRAESATFEQHLNGCAICRSEVASVRSVSDAVTELIPDVSPPERAWARVRRRVLAASGGGEPGEDAAALPPGSFAEVLKIWAAEQPDNGDWTFVAASDPRWLPTEFAGIDVRPLHVDRGAGRVTCVVRMAAGTFYPPHHHAGLEECFVLQGDLRVGDDLHMQAGDYQRAEAGSGHAVQSTDGGCLLLITSSLSDAPV